MTSIADEARKPEGGAEFCRIGEPCVLNASLLERVLERENLLAAWRFVSGRKLRIALHDPAPSRTG